MTVEEKALIWARRQKGNVLNNKNVDCFIAGYNMAAKEYGEIIKKGYKDVFTGLPDKLKKNSSKMIWKALVIADIRFPIRIGLSENKQRITHYVML